MQKYIIMGFKGAYKHKTSASKTGLFFLLIFVSVILHTILAFCLIAVLPSTSIEFIWNQELSNQSSVNTLKLFQLISSIGLFIAPTLLYSYLTGFDFKFRILIRQSVIIVLAIMMLITPFIALLLEWNMQIPLPQYLSHFDQNSEAIIRAFLKMSTFWDLFYTLIVLAIIPAIGEELLFRGYLQQKISVWLKNYHVGILITAFLFSVMHLDIYGVLPRFVLGVLLGYFFYWSGSVWLPILAHFVNNAQAVVFSYPTFKTDLSIYSVLNKGQVDPILAYFSFFSVLLLLYLLFKCLSIKKD